MRLNLWLNRFVSDPDTTPPAIEVQTDPTSLWPPNGQMVLVRVSGNISDEGSGVDTTMASFVVEDDYGRVQPHGDIALVQAPDGICSFSFTIQLEAKRDRSSMPGRNYTVRVDAKDRAGNANFANAVVNVPHDQGKGH